MPAWRRSPPSSRVHVVTATDVPVHGHQEGRFFHGFYDHHCFLPLYVFRGEQPSALRYRDGAAGNAQ
jgi:hypothetical protein